MDPQPSAGAANDELLDFLYLDVPRLASFASQLFGGLPSTTTTGRGRETEVGAELEAALPFLVRGSGNTKAVLSAASTVTSTAHHELVTELIRSLRDRGFLHGSALGNASLQSAMADGAFILVEGELQILG